MFYAANNSYASATDIGFANTWFVVGFETRRERDDYVAAATDMAARAITRAEVRQYAQQDTIPTGFYSGRRGYVVQTGTAGDCVYIR